MIFWLIILLMILITFSFAVPAFSKNRGLAILILILIPLASLIIYLTSGRYAQWKQHLHFQREVAAVKTEIQQSGQPKKLIQQLEEKAKDSPNDPKAWYFLGKLYLGTQQYAKAYEAFTHAKSLDPENMEVQFLAIQTAFFMHHTLTSEEKKYLEALLKKQPESISVLDLLALEAYQNKNYSLAIQYWQQILNYLPSDATKDRQAILDKISQTQKIKSGIAATAESETGSSQ